MLHLPGAAQAVWGKLRHLDLSCLTDFFSSLRSPYRRRANGDLGPNLLEVPVLGTETSKQEVQDTTHEREKKEPNG